jgi:hypothetical protein
LMMLMLLFLQISFELLVLSIIHPLYQLDFLP